MQVEYCADDFCAIAAVNDDETLSECLARSPDIASGRLPLTLIKDAPSMAKAYNQGLAKTDREICVFVHQDVYLPDGWLERACNALNELTNDRPGWMVVGPYGVRENGEHVGRVWDANMERELGFAGFSPTQVGSLDELLLVLRRPDGFWFDDALPHFHLYGTDLAQTAKKLGRGVYALEMPVIHNNRPWDSLAGGYLEAYRYARHKWRDQLPIPMTVCTLTRNPLHLLRARWRRRHVKHRGGRPLRDARKIAQQAGYEFI